MIRIETHTSNDVETSFVILSGVAGGDYDFRICVNLCTDALIPVQVSRIGSTKSPVDVHVFRLADGQIKTDEKRKKLQSALLSLFELIDLLKVRNEKPQIRRYQNEDGTIHGVEVITFNRRSLKDDEPGIVVECYGTFGILRHRLTFETENFDYHDLACDRLNGAGDGGWSQSHNPMRAVPVSLQIEFYTEFAKLLHEADQTE